MGALLRNLLMGALLRCSLVVCILINLEATSWSGGWKMFTKKETVGFAVIVMDYRNIILSFKQGQYFHVEGINLNQFGFHVRASHPTTDVGGFYGNQK